MNASQHAETHEVFNQVPPLDGANLYRVDLPLQEWSKRFGGGWAEQRLDVYGGLAGGELMAAGFLANENKPVFKSHDRYGNRADLVEFHPAYHQLMSAAIEHGLPSMPWTDPRAGAQVARAAMSYLHSQAEAGSGCPLTMTFASVPALKLQADVAEKWLPKILSTQYDPRNLPIEQKTGATIGMAMTEKQGGTDVRANTTRAYPIGLGGPGQGYELVGHKWFCSAPMCDAFLTLAYTDKGLSCFLLPRHRPDGTRNAFYIQRLKNKLGNWANASSEVEYRGAFAWMLGEEGRGVPTIIEMVAMTRFDCMIGSSAGQRAAVSQALHHCSLRSAFGTVLNQQPLMQNVLADLVLESEGSLALTMRMARAMDQRATDPHEDQLARLLTAVGKYWICKRTPQHAYEAMECIGGSGVMEDSPFPRLFRESPVNAIWEGSGNVQCLDVLRAMQKTPDVVQAFFQEVARARGGHAQLDRYVADLQRAFTDLSELVYRARDLVGRMALAVQAALLVQHAPSLVADAFCASRLSGGSHHHYGILPRGVDCAALMARATPQCDA